MNWAILGAAAAGASALSAALTHRWLSQRLRQRERRMAEAAQEQVTQGTAQLRAAMTKLQLELEKERVSSRQRVSAGLAEQRALAVRLQGQLKLAYAHLDHLREESGVAISAHATRDAGDTNGFAPTRPFVDTAH